MASNSDPPSDTPANVPIREELINTAVKFLSNPNVQKSSVTSRETFLRGKGLTEQEIAIAFQRTPVSVAQPYQPPQGHTAVTLPYPQGYLLPQQSAWGRFRDTVNTVAIIGGFFYGLYLLYKRYIAPFLFGPTPKKPSPIEASIAALDQSVKTSFAELKTEMRSKQTDMEEVIEQQMSAQKTAVTKQVDGVKSEINSLKGLLLNRKQFPISAAEPAALASEPVTLAPEIPSWQQEEKHGLLNGNGNAGEDEESVA